MKIITVILITCLALIAATKLYANLTKKKVATNTTTTQNKTETITQLHDLSYTTLLGDTIPLSTYKGKVLLIVNTASHCGFTYQYKHLQELYETFQDENFEIIGFPCNQFGNQEPGTNAEIKEFAISKGVKFEKGFDFFSKIDVNGRNVHPLWDYLKKQD